MLLFLSVKYKNENKRRYRFDNILYTSAFHGTGSAKQERNRRKRQMKYRKHISMPVVLRLQVMEGYGE